MTHGDHSHGTPGESGGVPGSSGAPPDVDALVADQLLCEPRKRRWIWIVYAALYAIAIPWYWPAGFRGPLLLGLPLWVAVSLLSVGALGVWTVFVISRYWIDLQGGD